MASTGPRTFEFPDDYYCQPSLSSSTELRSSHSLGAYPTAGVYFGQHVQSGGQQHGHHSKGSGGGSTSTTTATTAGNTAQDAAIQYQHATAHLRGNGVRQLMHAGDIALGRRVEVLRPHVRHDWVEAHVKAIGPEHLTLTIKGNSDPLVLTEHTPNVAVRVL